MKKSTIVLWIIVSVYLLVGCSIGYYVHKHNEEQKLQKLIDQEAKNILETPDLTKKIHLNLQTTYETNYPAAVQHSPWTSWMYNHRSTNNE